MANASISSPTGPLVSVCLPVFNGGAYLQAAVASILAQSYRNLELLVFDNASTDNTWAILEAIEDPRLYRTRNPSNVGAEANWNLALAAAAGRYIKVMHHDDLLAPECLARQVAALEACPSAVLAFCARTIIRPDGRPIMTRTPPWQEGEVASAAVLQGCLRAGTNQVGEPCGVLFRTEASRAAGSFDGTIPYIIDLDYWVRLLDHGTGYCLKAPLASYRISRDQWSATIGRNQYRQFIAFLEHLTHTGRCPMGPWTLCWAKFMARRNQMLRRLAYRFLAEA